MHVENGRKRVERVAWQAVPADTAESGSLDHGEERGWKRKETRGVNIEISPSSSFFFSSFKKETYRKKKQRKRRRGDEKQKEEDEGETEEGSKELGESERERRGGLSTYVGNKFIRVRLIYWPQV